jgi:hypothetical protein
VAFAGGRSDQSLMDRMMEEAGVSRELAGASCE